MAKFDRCDICMEPHASARNYPESGQYMGLLCTPCYNSVLDDLGSRKTEKDKDEDLEIEEDNDLSGDRIFQGRPRLGG